MSSFDRRRALILLALGAGAAGCGFRPALGPDGAARALYGEVEMIVPRGRLGFALRERLQARLGRAGAQAPYRLTADLTLSDSGLAITADSSITRFVVRGESRWRLTGLGETAIEGVEQSLSAYSATASLFATRAARRDAEARVTQDLAERIATAAAAALATRDAA